MKYQFTDGTRRVLDAAREEALALDHDYVGTEHILLALAGAGGDVAGEVLSALGAGASDVRRGVLSAVRRGDPARAGAAPGELPYTSRAKKVLELAMAEARALKQPYVGTEHLLLGVLREERGVAARVLEARGISAGRARRELVELLAGGSLRASPAAASFAIEIDDASSSSIYEQIVARVQEGVATGSLRPGDRIPPLRRLADELDIAPGTVARAYGELERLGVVVTDGARGTRVAEPERSALPADERRRTLEGLLRPVAVAAYHLGSDAAEFRAAAEAAMAGILGDDATAA